MSEEHQQETRPAGAEDEETLLARHRKEKKELVAKVQSLKKAKVDKKKKKELQDEIARLEADLEARHSDELNRLNALKISDKSVEVLDDQVSETAAEEKQPKLSKAQRRREKKSQDNKEREAQIKAEEMLHRDSPRILEDRKIVELLTKRGLAPFPVPADGDCLYNAVKHQLARIGICEYETSDLRQLAADYIEANQESLICYMTNPETADILSEEEFRKYCFQVRNTKAWGGEIEVKALSSSLKCPIEIVQASGTSPVHGEEGDPERKLVLTYHRHMYRLGEHYNSTVPIGKSDDGGVDEEEEQDDG
ncbi:deubiquitinase OTUD6B [Topomyia yanbarensis]|uniref:deubiquitinase OTUD6B n=1 Tax=Topomyia yanbarensis TaxID=2498891 RepID=UPI00273B9194|nr:deubiquitinase OTUD6B [Topomyia yanbarensis]